MTTSEATLGGARPTVARIEAVWQRAALVGILGLSAFLNAFQLGQNEFANTYYSAAVRSMLESWHNFLYVSFDPGGLVSVDKPPLALWAQAASAKVFGFSSWSILLPQALAGVLAVGLLYALIARVFGRLAGLAGALALAVSPVSVAVNRDNNPDALLAVLLVASAYVGLRAVESGRLRTLLLSSTLVGLAFNTKMLVAAIVVPGLGLAYIAFARLPLRRRIANLGAALCVLVVVAGAWLALVELTPASDRPYVGSTSDNSALSLALGYNGLGRVTGQEGGTSIGGGLGGAFSGVPGTLRLLNDSLGDQGAWLLPFAIVGLASAAIAAVRRRHRLELATLTVLGGWFAAGVVIFSYSSGIIHTYYLSVLAPASAGLVGIGVVRLFGDLRRGGAYVALPLTAIALTAWLQIDLLKRSDYNAWLRLVVAAGAVGALALGASLAPREAFAPVRARLAVLTMVIAFGACLAAPTVWAASTLGSPVNGVFPGAGPSYLSEGGGPGGGRRGPGGSTGRPGGGPGTFAATEGSGIADALAYVKSHGAAARFGLIVQSEQEAASAVIEGEPVASMGGFTGRETVLTAAYLSELVRSGEARYFLLGGTGGFGPGGGRNVAVSTVESACRPVSPSAWTKGTTAATLYDCAGRAEAIAATDG